MAIRSYLGIDEARAGLEQALDGLDTSSPHTRLALMEGRELVVELLLRENARLAGVGLMMTGQVSMADTAENEPSTMW